jgi:phosphoglycerate dehydrogenase-like enzyme
MSLNVHLLEAPDADDLGNLKAQLSDSIRLTTGEKIPADAQLLVAGRPRREHLDVCPNLCAVIIPWAGVPETTRDLLAEYPHIAVHNLHHNAAATAEMAVALLMSAAKFIVPLDRKLRSGDWRPRYERSQSIGLEGKTALILGYGEIGRRAARVCAALGMSVLATRRNFDARTAVDPFAEVHASTDLKQLLPRAHALIVTLPLTTETKGLIGEAELALMPRGAILVNVGRGAIVDEWALYHALQEGHIAAAGLDVWYNYPADEASRSNTPPSKYPFHELDNVVMSPHRGGDDADIERLRMAHLARLLNAAARDEPMPNRVDLKAGY